VGQVTASVRISSQSVHAGHGSLVGMTHDVVLASLPMVGHVNPLRPIARALVERGHDVRWYTGVQFAASVEATGARFLPMSADVDRGIEDRVTREQPAQGGIAGMRHGIKHGFLDPVPGQVADLSRIMAEEPCDVLVAEFGVLGADAVHELTGVPWASVGVSPLIIASRDTAPFGLAMPPSSTLAGRARNRFLNTFLDRVLMRDVRRYDRGIRARIGLPPDRRPLFARTVSPLLHLQNGIADLEYPRSDMPAQLHFVGALTEPAGRSERPVWASEVEGATVPVVHVTQGTVADADLTALVLPTIRALADENVLVVAGTGRHDPAALGPLPANVRVASYVPHDWLMAHTAVMVTNGGFGGVQVALSHGVPLVVGGATEDKPEVAARVAWSGAGVDLRTGTPTADQIRDAVRLILAEQRFARRAAEMRDAYAKLDAAEESATLIEALADTGLPVNRRWPALAARP
jgi:UDP:flavonoid glycosyltransferase YjiC (YdhE family)